MKRIILKKFCNQEEGSIKRDSHLHFLRESITDTCLLSSLDRFIVLIWKTDVDSRLSVGSPCINAHALINVLLAGGGGGGGQGLEYWRGPGGGGKFPAGT